MNFQSFTSVSAVGVIGALGTASFGLVDALKTLPGGGISDAGFAFVKRAVATFFGEDKDGTRSLLGTLHGNWVNGRELTDQKAIAKSLIKLRLNDTTAKQFASATGVTEAILKSVGGKMSNNTPLSPDETNVLGRFDLALSAILDDAYQHADQRYRNWAKLAAMLISVILASCGGLAISSNAAESYVGSQDMWVALIAGLLATPLAPMSKDIASALQAGVKVAQAVRK
jgi:hypothetical protein